MSLLTQTFTPNVQLPGLPPVLQPRASGIASSALNEKTHTSTDELGQLLEIQFNGIPFPTVSFEEKNSHSLIKHLYPNQDNARVENTGFNPREWVAVAHLTNHIFPAQGGKETWIPGDLFPNTFNQLSTQFQKTTTGILQHPIIGQVNCKVVSWDWRMTGEGPRDGVVITVNFLECWGEDFLPPVVPYGGSLFPPADALDHAAQAIPTQFHPPGLSIPGMFTQIAAYVRSLTAFPGQLATSLNARLTATISSFTSILAAAVSTPGSAYDTAVGLWNLNRYTAFGTAQFFEAFNFTSSQLQHNSGYGFSSFTFPTLNTGGLVQSSTNPLISGNTNVATTNVNYDLGALIDVHVAYQSLIRSNNSTPAQILGKTEIFFVKLFLYYKSLRENQTAPMQSGLLQMLFAVQTAQNSLTVQARNSNGLITLSFVSQLPMTWIDAARYTNNDIDDIMQLNGLLSNTFVIPQGSTIQYYSQTGN